MNSNLPIDPTDPEDLTLYALQFLSPTENARVRQELERSAAAREELARIQGDLALLASTAEMQQPSPGARDRLLQAIARERRPRVAEAAVQTEVVRSTREQAARSETNPARSVPTFGSYSSQGDSPQGDSSEDEPQPRSSRGFGRVLPWIGWTGWAVAAGLAFLFIQSKHERDVLRDEVASVNHQIAVETAQSAEARRIGEAIADPTAQRVTLTLSKQTPAPQGRAIYVPARGTLLFTAGNLEPLDPAKVYELWLIPSNGDKPLAAGTFHPDEKGNATLNATLPQGLTAKAFGITIEDDGGSQTPTMPILLAGSAGQ